MLTKQPSDRKDSKAAPRELPGQGISTAGFAVAVASIFTNFFTLGVMAIVALVLSIVGRVQTSKAGHPSGLALAGIIISSVVGFLTFAGFIFFLMLAIFAADHPAPVCDGWHDDAIACEQDGWDHYDDRGMPRYRYNASESQPDA